VSEPAQTAAPSPVERKRLVLVRPRGFCAGVVRAIDIVRLALERFGPPVYVRKEIVHNRHVVEELRQAGAIFVDELTEVPEGALVIFSAHGVSPAVRQLASERRLQVIDATCPLVTKVHLEAIRFARQGYTIILIGHRDHDEVIGTLGEAPHRTVVIATEQEAESVEVPDPNRVAYLTQTTLSLDETRSIIERLRERFPAIRGPAAEDICYATQNRQNAVKAVAGDVDLVLVVGSSNSSNSQRLVEVARRAGTRAYLVEDARGLQEAWLEGVHSVAVTAGASAPEVLVQELVEALRQRGFDQLEEVQLQHEDVRFALPAELVQVQNAPGSAGTQDAARVTG